MKFPARRMMTGAIAMALLSAPAFAQTASGQDQAEPPEADSQAQELDRILVVGLRASRVSSGATNLDLPIKETPQSISVVERERMEQFGADNLNDALRMATGIQVEQFETNLTQYLARGFEIKNTQLDGVGLPNSWGMATNAMDSFGFEKLEVIRGANGLLTGVGNAAGTINYVRKRPTNTPQGQFGATVGSHGRRRVQADYSAPFTEDGTWAGRVVAVREEADSYLRDFQTDRTYLYGVVDGQVGDNGTVALGYSWQKSDSSNNMWGALTFTNTEGEQIEWDRSASPTQDWTYWNSTTHAGFVEYTHQLGPDWRLKAAYNYRVDDHDAKLFMSYSMTGVDPDTGEGLVGWAYYSPYKTTAHLGDVSLSGQYQLFGREHEAMLGASSAISDRTDWWHPPDMSEPAFGALPPFPFPGDAIPEPTWGERTVYTTLNQRLARLFGVTRLELSDRLKLIAGFNWSRYQRDGVTDQGEHFDQTETNLAPYAGLTFDFTENVLGYVNYSYIFQPQDQRNIEGDYIDPGKGVNYEVGIKAEWLDQRLLTTLAWFNADQLGMATYAGEIFLEDRAFSYYIGEDVEASGLEFEATGRLNEHVDIQFGYTWLRMDGAAGRETHPWVPRRTANLLLSARLPGLPLSLGLGGRWQSEVYNAEWDTGFVASQESYALLQAFAAWDIRPDLTLRLNLRNLTDEKYINSRYAASYYGPPREYALSLDWRF